MKATLKRWLGRTDPRLRHLADLPPGTVGRGTYGPVLIRSFTDSRDVTIGRYCSFALYTEIWLGGNHRHDWVTTYPFTIIDPKHAHIPGGSLSRGNVVIGNDVWVGSGALILSGVTVGNGAVIGARAVVSRDVEPYAIVVGNPGRMVRHRFPSDQVAALQRIAWWNWDEPRIDRAMPLLMQGDIGKFITAVDAGEI